MHNYCRGSAIARIVGENVKENPIFYDEVKMWVFEEVVDGRKLTEIINQDHENSKYLPGFKIPSNVVSEHFTNTQPTTVGVLRLSKLSLNCL